MCKTPVLMNLESVCEFVSCAYWCTLTLCETLFLSCMTLVKFSPTVTSTHSFSLAFTFQKWSMSHKVFERASMKSKVMFFCCCCSLFEERDLAFLLIVFDISVLRYKLDQGHASFHFLPLFPNFLYMLRLTAGLCDRLLATGVFVTVSNSESAA